MFESRYSDYVNPKNVGWPLPVKSGIYSTATDTVYMAAVNAMVCKKVHGIGGEVRHPYRVRGKGTACRNEAAAYGLEGRLGSDWKSLWPIWAETGGDCPEHFPPMLLAQHSANTFEITLRFLSEGFDVVC